jgi:hypothetical protein
MAIDYYAESAAKTLCRQIDFDVLEDILDDANVVDNAVVGDPSVNITDKTFRDVRATLVKQGVAAEDIVIVLTPDHSAEAMGLDVFRSADYVNNATVINGQLPLRIYGMSVYMDAVNLPTVEAANSISGSSTTDYVSMAMHRDAVKFVMAPLYQPNTNNADVSTANIDGMALRSKMWYDPDLNASRLVLDALYGVKLLKHATVQGDDNSLLVPILGGAS